MYIKGRVVTIRGIEKEDLPLLKDLMNSVEVENMTVRDHFPISMYQEEQWYMSNITKSTCNKYIIETEKDGAVGMISIEDIDWRNRSFQVPLKILPSKCSQVGIGVDAHMAMLRYAFDQMQMHRAFGVTLEYNQASLNMQRLCGYTVEGRKRSAVYKNGKYHDLILTSLLRDEYYKFVEEEEYWED
ncbi:MAG: GNAT family N-acetyltransferase [Agathobacter sp.]|nr:GNAT family N-acetyltransferase [Agathobacter sp.]